MNIIILIGEVIGIGIGIWLITKLWKRIFGRWA
jgi:hypothetical protein